MYQTISKMNRICEVGFCKLLPNEGEYVCRRHVDYFKAKKKRKKWINRYINPTVETSLLIGFQEGTHMHREETHIRNVTKKLIILTQEEVQRIPATNYNTDLYLLLCENQYINPLWNKRLLMLCIVVFVKRRQHTFQGFWPTVESHFYSLIQNRKFGYTMLMQYLISEMNRYTMINVILPSHRVVDFGLIFDDFFKPTKEEHKAYMQGLTGRLSYYSKDVVQSILKCKDEKVKDIFENNIYKYIQQAKTFEKQNQRRRFDPLKREIMETVWHPRNVERWLEQGGFELLENLF
jgi:hypothetical protein